MKTRKLQPSTGSPFRAIRARRATSIPVGPVVGEIDIRALFDDTTKRYPSTIARLAE